MANLFDLLRNLGNKAQQIQPIQLAENGGVDVDKTLQLSMQQPRTLGQHLFGRELGVDVDTTNVNPETGEKQITTERVAKFQPGFFNNLASGARENFTTGFAANNLTDNTANGVKKGFGYRLGEGLGTLARIGESPLGRGLIVSGLVGLTGGNPLQAMAYGATAGVGNQSNRMRDKVYRNDLIRSEQQALLNNKDFQNLDVATQQQLLNDVANNVNNLRGYITNDVYRNMIDSRIAQENAAYRRMYYDNQRRNDEALLKYKQQQLEADQNQQNIDNAFRNREISIKEKEALNNKNTGRVMPATSATNLSGTQQGINQMATLMGQIPKYARLGLAGPVGSLRRFNPYDADAQAFQQYVNTYKQVIGKGLEGGVLRKEDEAKYEKIIPRMGDTEEVLMRKAEQLQQMLIDKYNTDLEALYNAGYDTGNFNYFSNKQNQTGKTTKSGIKYEVID